MYSDLKIDNLYLGGLQNTVPESLALVAVTDPKDLAWSLTFQRQIAKNFAKVHNLLHNLIGMLLSPYKHLMRFTKCISKASATVTSSSERDLWHNLLHAKTKCLQHSISSVESNPCRQ